jgi:hypothetical protein
MSRACAPQQTCVIYEAQTGAIVHIHHASAAAGAEMPSGEAIIAEALRLGASTTGLDSSQLGAMPVDAGALRVRREYAVDLSTGELTELPMNR